MDPSVLILGARGSAPASGPAFQRYGGATTCFLVRLGGQTVVIDAGTGLMNLPDEVLHLPSLPLLLTHPHADHMTGLPLCPYVMQPGGRMEIYGAARSGLNVEEQVRRLLSPPLWPVGPEHFAGSIRFLDLPEDWKLGGIRVRAMEGIHPGGVSLLRLDGGGASVACMTDCVLTEALLPKAAAFARGCGLLLCDGQYSDAEWESRSGFGHNTWRMAARLGKVCGAARVRVVHHDPLRTDAALDAATAELSAIHPQCSFAREGEEVAL